MGNNFVDNGIVSTTGTGLPGTKSDSSQPLTVPSNQGQHALEFNAVTGALTDLKTAAARSVSIMSFGADPTGATDSSSALAAACAALSSGGVLHLPVGQYRLSVSKSTPANVTLAFDSSLFSIDNGVTLTIAGQINAPPVRIFSFAGSPSAQAVAFQATCLHPINVAWFGCIGDGTTDNAGFFKQASLSAYTRGQLLAELAAPSPNTVYPRSVLLLPAGRYEVASTLEVGSFCTLLGELGAVIQSSDSTISLLRIQPAYTDITQVGFAGGLNAIALCGFSTYFNSYLNPSAFGNAPCLIDRCSFSYQAGPSIWQDYGQVAFAAAVSQPSVPMSGGTITFTGPVPSTWPATGQVAPDGCTGIVSYTGKSGDTLTGCSGGGTGAVTIGGATGYTGPGAGPFNTGQFALRVTNFEHAGACIYWGASDIVEFDIGHSAADFTNAPLDDIGFPLGLFNTYDTFTLNNFRCDLNGTQAPRVAMVVGSSQISLNSCAFGQDDEICVVRQRISANTYQGKRISAVIGGTPSNPIDNAVAIAPLNLTLKDCDLACAFQIMWLEIYEAYPRRVSLTNAIDTANFDFGSTYGVWFDRATVPLPTDGLTGQFAMLWDFDQPPVIAGSGFEDHTIYSFFYGFDPGTGATPSPFNSVDVSDQFLAYRTRVEPQLSYPSESAAQRNLVNNQTVDAYGTYLGVTSGSPSGTFSDATFGIGQTGFTGGLSWEFLIADAFLDLEAASATPGIYCFSLYLKVNYPVWLTCFAGPETSGTGSALAVRRLAASSSWQRIEYPFYYPGNPATCRVIVDCPKIAPTIIAWPASTAVTIGTQITNDSGKLYFCTAVTGDAKTAASGGPTGTGQSIVDNHVTWDYVSPGGTFAPSTVVAGWMVNAGRKAAPFVFANNNDSAGAFGWVPRIYYGTAAPTSGKYFVGDQVVNTAPSAGGFMGWVCTTAGVPGTWKPFGSISP